MEFAKHAFDVFNDATTKYHITDHVDAQPVNPYPESTIDHTLWAKNWIDAVQWHLEDIIRDPQI